MADTPDFDQATLAKLAREMAMNIRNYKAIFSDFNIDEEQYYEIEKIPFFQRVKEQYVIEWNATSSTAERVKVCLAAGAEEILPFLVARAMNDTEPLASATKTFEVILKAGGIDSNKEDNKPNERFVITINLGADTNGNPVIEKFDKSLAIDVNDNSTPPKLTTGTPEELALQALMELSP